MHIRVNGEPAPQGSVKAFAIKRGGQYTGRVGIASASPAHGSWRNAVAEAAAAYVHNPRPGGSVRPVPLFSGPCIVSMIFYLPRPKNHYGTGRNAGQIKPQYREAWPLTKDWDKLARTVCDALQLADVVADDKQIAGTPGVWRVYADYGPPGADIWVDSVPPGIPALMVQAWQLRAGKHDGAAELVDLGSGRILVNGDHLE